MSRLKVLTNRRFQFPKQRVLERALRQLTYAEKVVLYSLIGLFAFSSLTMLWQVNRSVLVDVPLRGGALVEGVTGNPRFINPVLAISEADKNLVSLIYTGLVRPGTRGRMVNDLARDVVVSSDGLVYTATLDPRARFHDGVKVTADDIVFTVQKILDPSLKSPLLGNFAGVTVSKVNDETVTFTLKKPYAPFLSNLRVGILPKHIWNSVTNDEFSFSQWNVLPIGTGPYKVERVTRDSGGIPNYYELAPFEEYLHAEPYIAKLVFKFYPSMNDILDAYHSGDIQSFSGISPEEASQLEDDGVKVVSSPLPRIFGVFFNQNMNKALLDKSVRHALDLTAPKKEIVDLVLKGFGTVIDSPFPPESLSEEMSELRPVGDRLAEASSTLSKAGWVKNPDTGILEKKSKNDTLKLSFTLSTSDNPELEAAAKLIQKAWQDLGAEVELSIYESGDLNQNVIRPRRYEALLFGEVVGRDLDVYPFWHSSERNDPGLNIALYTNSDADTLLSDARSEGDPRKRLTLYKSFEETIKEDVPAVFLYSPDFLAVYPEEVRGVAFGSLSSPQDRYLGISKWYIETNPVWTVFAKDSLNQTKSN